MSKDSDVEIILASDQDIYFVESLWREYWDSLGLSEDFQNFAEELGTLPGKYAAPQGRLLLALLGGNVAGTAALRPLSSYACEAKRLFVRPQFRGKGIGKLLLLRLIDEARSAGYQEMYADTLPSMQSALQMYRAVGFSEIAPYSANPTPGAIYLRLSVWLPG